MNLIDGTTGQTLRSATRREWLVECDDERRRFATRAQAREYAGWLNRHPANRDIRAHGPYRNVDGRARVEVTDG